MAPTLCTKIEKFFEEELAGQLENWIGLIIDGQLLDFERLLRKFGNFSINTQLGVLIPWL